jgi:hypothetical protein
VAVDAGTVADFTKLTGISTVDACSDSFFGIGAYPAIWAKVDAWGRSVVMNLSSVCQAAYTVRMLRALRQSLRESTPKIADVKAHRPAEFLGSGKIAALYSSIDRGARKAEKRLNNRRFDVRVIGKIGKSRECRRHADLRNGF